MSNKAFAINKLYRKIKATIETYLPTQWQSNISAITSETARHIYIPQNVAKAGDPIFDPATPIMDGTPAIFFKIQSSTFNRNTLNALPKHDETLNMVFSVIWSSDPGSNDKSAEDLELFASTLQDVLEQYLPDPPSASSGTIWSIFPIGSSTNSTIYLTDEDRYIFQKDLNMEIKIRYDMPDHPTFISNVANNRITYVNDFAVPEEITLTADSVDYTISRSDAPTISPDLSSTFQLELDGISDNSFVNIINNRLGTGIVALTSSEIATFSTPADYNDWEDDDIILITARNEETNNILYYYFIWQS